MKLLAIDTSGLVCSVAVTEDGCLRALYSIQHRTTHSQILLPMVQDIREKLSLEMKGLDAIAVAAGPGSFTGLRIGAATAKALCLALEVPLIPVPTLEAMAYRLWGTEGRIVPMMDARRGQVYAGCYRCPAAADTGALPQVLLSGGVRQVEELAEALNRDEEPLVFLGDGVPVYREKLASLLHGPWTAAPLHRDRQSADALAALAEARVEALGEAAYTDADRFTPDYMRLSQAERQALEGKLSGGKAGTAGAKPEVRYRTRLITPADLPEASALERACLGQEAWSGAQLAEAADREDTIYLVTQPDQADNEIIALCGIRNVAGVGEITNVCVAEAHRGHHVARKMLSQLLERARGLGIHAYTLEVRSGNKAAIALYEGLGFVPEGTRPGFYTNPTEDAAIYWLRERGNP